MPHRNMKCLDELEKSLQMIANSNTNIMLTGDFNCPDINWESMSVPNNSSDKEIQTKLMEITSSFQLTQIHEQPTREDNLLDIVLTTNPSLVKTSKNTPGISDHEMIQTVTPNLITNVANPGSAIYTQRQTGTLLKRRFQ